MLAESHESLPSEIVQLMPHISAVQLAEYGELVKKALDSSAMLEAIREQAARHVSLIELLSIVKNRFKPFFLIS